MLGFLFYQQISNYSQNKLGDIIFKLKDILEVINELNLNFSKFTLSNFSTEINIELDHGLINKNTNVTDNNLLTTAKITFAYIRVCILLQQRLWITSVRTKVKKNK